MQKLENEMNNFLNETKKQKAKKSQKNTREQKCSLLGREFKLRFTEDRDHCHLTRKKEEQDIERRT